LDISAVKTIFANSFRFMSRFAFVCILLFVAPFQSAMAQQLPTDRHTGKAVANGTRSVNGAPGNAYWQNKGDYDIDVNVNPVSCQLSGTVRIDYVNNSPDTLKTMLFKLYPNLYKGSSMRNTQIATADLSNGVQVNSLTLDDRAIDSTQWRINGTNMYLRGSSVLPRQRVRIQISFAYSLNKGSFNRTGRITDGAYFIAYFFPRIAVYDDIDGWNEYPYLGKEEFYNDYGNFRVRITVPGTYQVWATGDLKNTAEVYEPAFAEKISQAERQDDVIDVITAEDLKRGRITKSQPTNSWQFEAINVTDFAFAVSNNYVWKAASLVVDPQTQRRTRVDAVYNPDHKTYESVVGYASKTVAQMSNHFPGLPFPYAHMTLVDGLDAMEYPMMVNMLPFADEKDIVEFTAHEIFHMLFPFYVGTNETKYSFMDEGWATMMEFLFHPLIAPTVNIDYDLSSVNEYAGLAEDVPIMTPTAQLYGKARYADKDLKPALALFYLREWLGEKRFTQAVQHYIRTWAGKHPTPYDFFASMNAGAGMNLNWYWKRWYFEKAIPDLAISSVSRKEAMYQVTVTSPGTAPVPIHLTAFYQDGTKQVLKRSAGIWADGRKKVVFTLKDTPRVDKISLGSAYDADIQPKNNSWIRPTK